MIKECIICQKQFDAKQSNYKTCSKQCQNTYFKSKMSQYYSDNRDLLIKKASAIAKREPQKGICVICNTEFIARKATTCCSEVCRSKLNLIKTCQRSKNVTEQQREERNIKKKIKYGENWNSYEGKRKIKAEKRRIRLSKDINFKLADTLRSRLKHALKGNYKTGSAVKDLGCSIEDLKRYLESKFVEGMTWDNRSKDGWHIDHIRPLANFNLTNKEELLKACHYTNLQPLWAKDNLTKGNRGIAHASI